jgi:hypothetical protein
MSFQLHEQNNCKMCLGRLGTHAFTSLVRVGFSCPPSRHGLTLAYRRLSTNR